jgi:DNA-binding NtrC family response regulator
MRIMVVEDDIHVASLLGAALTHQGHQVISAHDAEEALALLARHRPDVLLLDVLLGELSGIDLLRRLRSTDQALPVVLLTGHATANVLKIARRLGVTDILKKPLGLKRLPQVLREALAGRATRPRRAPAQGRRSAAGPATR